MYAWWHLIVQQGVASSLTSSEPTQWVITLRDAVFSEYLSFSTRVHSCLRVCCCSMSCFPWILPFYFPSCQLCWYRAFFLAGIALAISIQEAFEDGTWYLYEQFAESNRESVSAVTSQLHWFIYNGACLPPTGLWCWMQQLIIPFLLEPSRSLCRGPCFLTSGNRRTLVQMRFLNFTLFSLVWDIVWDKCHPSPADWGELLGMPWPGYKWDNK